MAGFDPDQYREELIEEGYSEDDAAAAALDLRHMLGRI